MKNTKLITLFAVLFIGTIMISCGKYEEGPGFSLLPKKTRLQQKWKPVQNVDANGNINNIANINKNTRKIYILIILLTDIM